MVHHGLGIEVVLHVGVGQGVGIVLHHFFQMAEGEGPVLVVLAGKSQLLVAAAFFQLFQNLGKYVLPCFLVVHGGKPAEVV